MNNQLEYAFVLKNFVTTSNKVILLHQKLGKITCIYSYKDSAKNLCSGSLIRCLVEQRNNYYTFVNFVTEFTPINRSVSMLYFIHDILRLCLTKLPYNVAVKELFDFLLYVFQSLPILTAEGQQIVLLRLFLLFDLLPEKQEMYQCAIQDPHGVIKQSEDNLKLYVQACWDTFEHEKYLDKK